jgi:thiol-disulfide isomerase/thioredoxin
VSDDRADGRVFWILGGLLVLSLIGMAIGAAKMMGYDPGGGAGPQSGLVGQTAPELSLPVVTGEGAAQGDRVALSALRGQVVLLDFWASWCGPCRQSIPILNRIHERYGERIEMYGVNVEDNLPLARVQAAHRSFGAVFPSLQDQATSAQGAYGVRNIPTLVLIDRAGVVRWVDVGVPDGDEVAERVEEALAASP